MTTFSRRDVMQLFGAGALALAGPMAGRRAMAQDRSKELNILCWEGYNSAQVLDPFRAAQGATVRAESLTNDPTMINRLRAGETNVWDLINVNNPWARKIMLPEGLIKPLTARRVRAVLRKMLPAFKPPYRWAMSEDGSELLGMAQRFGPYSFVVNTDKISRATAEDQGWDLWNDPAQRRQVRHPRVRRLERVQHLRDRRHRPVQASTRRRRWRSSTRPPSGCSAGAKLIGDIATMNQALISGEIDFHLTGGTYSVSPGARRRLSRTCAASRPKKGPIDGKGGIAWIEITSTVNNPQLSPLAAEFLKYVQEPGGRPHRGLRRGHLQPGDPDGQPDVLRAASPPRSSTRSSGTAWRRRWRARSSTTSCPTTTRRST